VSIWRGFFVCIGRKGESYEEIEKALITQRERLRRQGGSVMGAKEGKRFIVGETAREIRRGLSESVPGSIPSVYGRGSNRNVRDSNVDSFQFDSVKAKGVGHKTILASKLKERRAL